MDEKILDRIQKLLRLSHNNTSQNEAEAAFAAAQKLMTEHRISLAEVASAGKTKSTVGTKRIHPGGERFTRWMTYLFNQTAQINGCRMILDSSKRPISYHVFGTASDIEIVEYLYNSIRSQVEYLCMVAMQTQGGFGKSWATNFKYGVVDRVIERMKQANAAVTATATSTAMVWLGKQTEEIEANVKIAYPRTRTIASAITPNQQAREMGRLAGNNVTMHRGIGQGNEGGRLK